MILTIYNNFQTKHKITEKISKAMKLTFSGLDE